MLRRLMIFAFTLSVFPSAICQVIIVPVGMIGAAITPEHGFLPGKKFTFYPTVRQYDLKGKRLRVELSDDRIALHLRKVSCSELELTNTSEFSSPDCIHKVGLYIDTLFRQSSIIPDSSAADTVKIRLEGLDVRLIGFGTVRVHGLCQMRMSYRGFTRVYCIDITDADKNSPLGPNAFVTRLTATRIMSSASMREVIEQIIAGLHSVI